MIHWFKENKNKYFIEILYPNSKIDRKLFEVIKKKELGNWFWYWLKRW